MHLELSDGMESLEYWRARRKRLAWYRVSARREARIMSRRWEQRVRAALLAPGVPLGTRVSAVLLLGRVRLQRLPLRAMLRVTAAAAICVALVPVLLTVLLLQQIV